MPQCARSRAAGLGHGVAMRRAPARATRVFLACVQPALARLSRRGDAVARHQPPRVHATALARTTSYQIGLLVLAQQRLRRRCNCWPAPCAGASQSSADASRRTRAEHAQRAAWRVFMCAPRASLRGRRSSPATHPTLLRDAAPLNGACGGCPSRGMHVTWSREHPLANTVPCRAGARARLRSCNVACDIDARGSDAQTRARTRSDG